MFTAFTTTPAADRQNMPIAPDHFSKKPFAAYLRQSPRIVAALLTGSLLLAGCQPQSATDDQVSETSIAEEDKAAVQSDAAAAKIAQFQPLYAAQMQALQRRLQAEYEALQAADMPDTANHALANSETDSDEIDSNTDVTTAIDTETETETETETDEINTSTEVGERDLEVLKRISLEPHQPEILTEAQMIERYQQAMQALYEPTANALNQQQIDTLINITTLLPSLFEHPEIAQRVSIKSPALARLIVQHQVGQQIQAQQVQDMQKMKHAQQQEFETLMTKFNATIEDYDQQIAKYEQTLTEFQE